MPRFVSPKKQRLTLAQLCAYDDILTDALVDQAYFWTAIRKNKHAYHPCRGITEASVVDILKQRVIIEEDPATAEDELLALPGLKKFSASLKTDKEKADFRAHLRKYINIYLAECPFEVTTTNRYTVVTEEAAVVARRYIKKGETVKYLCGVQVHMTEEEEEFIKSSRRDFSIVVSGRSGTASLFLGPARFANHDCDANARLNPTGNSGMEIVAYRNIDEGEEVTVSYGENYFGDDNCECLCRTCENLCRNGWTAPEGDDGTVIPQASIESATGQPSYSLRRRRKSTRQASDGSSREGSMTPDLNIRPLVSKRTPRTLARFKHANSPLGKSPSVEPASMPEVTPTPSKKCRLERELDNLATPTKKQKGTKTSLKNEVKLETPILTFSEVIGDHVPSTAPENVDQRAPSTVPENVDERAPSTAPENVDDRAPSTAPESSASPSPSSVENQTATDTTSVNEEDTIVVEPRVISPAVLKVGKTRGTKMAGLMEQADAGETLLVDSSTSTDHPAVIDEATALENTWKLGSKPLKGGRIRKRKEMIPIVDKDHAPSIRIPGDYVYTTVLLAEPATSWIICKTCEEPWVQKDSYFTKSSCNRCERHSKLYGYQWPKTEPEDSEDDEERVLDHRTIHRFIKPSEEKAIRRLAKESGESRAVTREVSEVVKPAKKPEKKPKPRKRKIKDESYDEDDDEADEHIEGRKARKRARKS